jgi:phosphoribosylamine--glycine ligase
MRLKNDLIDVVDAVIDDNLAAIDLDIDPRSTVCVVMASGGYPGSYTKGYAISGLEKAAEQKDVVVFHAGTAQHEGVLTNTGGRVLGVTAIDEDLEKAINKAYAVVDMIHWQDCYFRRDIGQKALVRSKK